MQQVSQDWFTEKFTELCTLMGWSVSDNRKIMIYEELINFDKYDFLQVFTRMKGEDKFIYANMWKHIAEIRAKRIETEEHNKHMREDEEIRQWFRDHVGKRTDCINNYQCGECKRVYCDIVAIDAGQAIKDMILNEGTDNSEINLRLANKFHGIGFERNTNMEAF